MQPKAAQKEIMDILKDIDHAKDYYERLAKDHNVLRTEESPRFRRLHNSPVHNKARDVQDILKDRGVIIQPNMSSTDFGNSAYFTVYHKIVSPKLKSAYSIVIRHK